MNSFLGLFVIVAAIALGIAAIHAQSLGGGGGMLFGQGGGTGSRTPPSPNPCASIGNQLDFSDTTGCNLVWGGH